MHQCSSLRTNGAGLQCHDNDVYDGGYGDATKALPITNAVMRPAKRVWFVSATETCSAAGRQKWARSASEDKTCSLRPIFRSSSHDSFTMPMRMENMTSVMSFIAASWSCHYPLLLTVPPSSNVWRILITMEGSVALLPTDVLSLCALPPSCIPPEY